jgi:hypothetical protein
VSERKVPLKLKEWHPASLHLNCRGLEITFIFRVSTHTLEKEKTMNIQPTGDFELGNLM